MYERRTVYGCVYLCICVCVYVRCVCVWGVCVKSERMIAVHYPCLASHNHRSLTLVNFHNGAHGVHEELLGNFSAIIRYSCFAVSVNFPAQTYGALPTYPSHTGIRFELGTLSGVREGV